MKVIDCSENKGQKAAGLGSLLSRVSQIQNSGENRAQSGVVGAMQKALDNRFTLLRRVTLKGTEITIPLILVGPPGLRVIYASDQKGVFRAHEEDWEEMDNRAHKFRTARPNLITRTDRMARAVAGYLSEHGFSQPEVEPVLLFSNPGLHVDSARPAVRVVMADALERFAAGLCNGPAVLDLETAQRIVASLSGSLAIDYVQPFVDAQDAFSFRDLQAPPRPRPPAVMDHSESALVRRIPFSRRQWLLLGLLTLVNILVISAFVMLILVTS